MKRCGRNAMIVKIEHDAEGNLILILPDAIVEQLGWVVNETVLEFIDNEDGTFTIRKVTENESTE